MAVSPFKDATRAYSATSEWFLGIEKAGWSRVLRFMCTSVSLGLLVYLALRILVKLQCMELIVYHRAWSVAFLSGVL